MCVLDIAVPQAVIVSCLLAGMTDRARSRSVVITCKLNHGSVPFERKVIFEDTV